MNITLAQNAWEDYEYWQQTDKTIMKKISKLIKDIIRSPYKGLGKPEPLKFDLKGLWFRRIDREHRLVYKITENTLTIYACRFHYDR